jgi:hypothetical protein
MLTLVTGCLIKSDEGANSMLIKSLAQSCPWA